MTALDRDELQRIAQLVEVNRERLQALEQQLRSLEGIKTEQDHAIDALSSIPEGGAMGVMLPLGAGVQLIADVPPEAGAVVDVGSRIQAEKTREEAKEIITKRNDELRSIMETIRKEYDDLEAQVVTLANRFNEAVDDLQSGAQDPEPNKDPQQSPPPKKRRRKRGTELTLDD
ncbi:MAG: prefoldin subunit alpha [Candidatus Thermoplasmatota archaeon]|nr:prefoldin subunit alpha [Candidatus Thermoplasmatota archaeon]